MKRLNFYFCKSSYFWAIAALYFGYFWIDINKVLLCAGIYYLTRILEELKGGK